MNRLCVVCKTKSEFAEVLIHLERAKYTWRSGEDPTDFVDVYWDEDRKDMVVAVRPDNKKKLLTGSLNHLLVYCIFVFLGKLTANTRKKVLRWRDERYMRKQPLHIWKNWIEQELYNESIPGISEIGFRQFPYEFITYIFQVIENGRVVRQVKYYPNRKLASDEKYEE